MKPFTSECLNLLDLDMSSDVFVLTHLLGHTVDLVMTLAGSDYVCCKERVPINSSISDHALTFVLGVARPLT